MRDVDDYLAEIARRCAGSLGPDLVGVYAGGSLALDGYRAGRSDIDVAVVTGSAVPEETKAMTIGRLRHESLPCPARGLELVVYRAEVAAAGDAEPGFEFELNTGEGMAFRETLAPNRRPPEDGSFWYAIDRSILSEHGWTIVGPPAEKLFRSPPEPLLAELVVQSQRWHLASSMAATDDAVLNACRAWHRAVTGHWLAKAAAGRAVRIDPGPLDPTVIDEALRARDGGRPPDPVRVRRFQQEVLNLLER
ncbi:MAG TPA: nucleotidyltransferase domain-containing protein [Nakamurella sp.]